MYFLFVWLLRRTKSNVFDFVITGLVVAYLVGLYFACEVPINICYANYNIDILHIIVFNIAICTYLLYVHEILYNSVIIFGVQCSIRVYSYLTPTPDSFDLHSTSRGC